MKENKFKVGDRVAVYGKDCDAPVISTGIIKEEKTNGQLTVIEDGTQIEDVVWRRQCRRLIPKKPKPGDEIWVSPNSINPKKRDSYPHISLSPVETWIKYKRCK